MTFGKLKISITIIFILFGVGMAGLLSPWQELFQRATPLTLLMSGGLLVWNHEGERMSLAIFALTSFLVGYGAEYLGVNHQMIFGEYTYGNTLGFKVWNVPLMIGVNWFITMYAIGSVVPKRFHLFWVILICSALAVLLDWIMEPVAVMYDFWSWHNGIIPLSNYIGWFAVSCLLFSFFQHLKLGEKNKFARWFLMAESVFFVVLNFASRI